MEDSPSTKIIGVAVVISIVLIAGVYIAFSTAKKQQGQVVLPGGVTYLGPTPTATPKQPDTHFSLLQASIIPVPNDATWNIYEGKVFPYSFSYPAPLSLGMFPNDPYDGVTIFYGNTSAQENLFFRVDNLTTLKKTDYIGKPVEYANNWYKDYTWSDVESVVAFTNSTGMKGYRAKYLDSTGKTPYDHVFFEVPGDPTRMIWITGRLFDHATFEKLIDSVSWKR